MFDIRWIRENPEAFDNGLARRGFEARSAEILALDGKRREALTAAQDFQTRRNQLSKEIGQRKAKGTDAAELMAQVAGDKDAQGRCEHEGAALSQDLNAMLAEIPNLPADDVPDGADESANVELRRLGDIPKFGFEAKEHAAIGEGLGMMDFELAAKLSGSRFVVLTGALARLERALGAFMLDLQTGEFGYREASVPQLVRDNALYGTGQLPKFAEDLFRTTGDHWLIPTAEVPLTNLVAGKILDEAALPLRYAALTACFRSEAGAAGKDTHGMIRQHQFDKVELVSITHPDHSDNELKRKTGAAEEVLRRMEIPYRVVVLATGDMGFAARKTHDIEVWLPGQGLYREISSCSNCGDFQARRMNARFRPKGDKGTRFVHTLNGSGLAVGRALIAVLENFQNEDGSVRIPEALRPYMDGVELITRDTG
ncbi:MAG: serine--tRNA ligase [Alphaproteobacteria bacterium]